MTVNEGGRNRFVRMNSEKGCSDIICCWRGGLYVAIECKRPGKKPTDDQQAFLDKVVRSGGIAIVATSIDDVANVLEELE